MKVESESCLVKIERLQGTCFAGFNCLVLSYVFTFPPARLVESAPAVHSPPEDAGISMCGARATHESVSASANTDRLGRDLARRRYTPPTILAFVTSTTKFCRRNSIESAYIVNVFVRIQNSAI